MLTKTIIFFAFFKTAYNQLYDQTWIDFLNVQKNLTTDLFKNYDPTVSPVFTRNNLKENLTFDNTNYTTKWNYTIELFYLQLVEIDEPSEKVTVVIEIMENWYDPRLVWAAEHYSNITNIYVRQEKIWSPSLSPYGINDVVDFRDQDFRQAAIDNTGFVFVFEVVRVSVTCDLDMRKFPFDQQRCLIQFGLPMYYINEVSVNFEIYEDIMKPEKIAQMGNSEWRIINLTNKHCINGYDDNMSGLELNGFFITMKRNPMYYFYMIILPAFVINTVSLFGVFMKASDKMSRLNVGLTTLMTMTFILGVIADDVPKTGVIPLLGIYIIIHLVIMILSIGVVMTIGKFRVLMRAQVSDDKKLQLLLGNPLENSIFLILQTLNIANFSMMYWYDPRLYWDPAKYKNLTSLYVRQDKIWSPSLSPYGINDVVDFRDQELRQASIGYTGFIFVYSLVRIAVKCTLDMKKFPFDQQTCLIQFGLPMYYVNEVSINFMFFEELLKPSKIEQMGNSEWKVVNLSTKRSIQDYEDAVSGLELNGFFIKLKRNPMYYFYMIILPAFVINAVSLFGVFMKKSDKMSRLNVGLTTLMTMTFILGVIANDVPKTGVIPLLGIYIIIHLVIMILSIGVVMSIGKFRVLIRAQVSNHKKLQMFLGDPLENTIIISLHVLNVANFSMMIVFWMTG
ncbi:unnamed protein product [Caenorhabditis angaria]|uniref:Neurotransmitter-gated ion-channel ligand-binding domain-containing protein n=1 Tax=Caenorhabditis angaria TaxID=860376 RepID=A0A9P1IZH9_9PELO|nr:unnamed protein product [Caenorhabditis angaria]